jgi:demethylmenaquinone methyltransferase/2-methoxy-6-polyprenyl-1,4-benzoquinol methylase
MFSAVFMKLLESRPRSYDRRMDAISKGRVGEMKRAVVDAVEAPADSRVLEIGCGTGELAEMLAVRGASVVGFDRSEAMVATAQERIEGDKTGELRERLTFSRMAVDGMDGLDDESYDVAVSTLVLSELNPDERKYTLLHAHRALKPGGQLIIADEVVPEAAVKRTLQALVRTPGRVATFLVSRDVSRPLSDLAGEIRAATFVVDREERFHGDTLAIVEAHKEP